LNTKTSQRRKHSDELFPLKSEVLNALKNRRIELKDSWKVSRIQHVVLCSKLLSLSLKGLPYRNFTESLYAKKEQAYCLS